jgi:[ribosomal protein S18]-alanine N-acetyltransferase
MLFSTLPAQLNLADGRVLNAEVVTEDAAVQLHPLELAAHSHPMSESLFRDNLARYHAIGIKLDDQWIGFALISMVVGEAELLDYVVDPKLQGQGIGGAFLEWIIEQLTPVAERFYLEVRASNAAAIALYEAAGFAEMGVRHNYYPAKKGREDALLMAMELFS